MSQLAPSQKPRPAWHRYWPIGLVLLALAGVGAYLVTSTGSPSIPAEALRTLNQTSFNDVNNQPRRLAEWPGHVQVVNFWATWCPPCRREMPVFSRLQEKLGPQGVQFFGIGIDSPSAIKEFNLQYPVQYPLLIGGSEGLELMRQLGNPKGALPYTLVLDSQGQPIFSHLGELDETRLEALFKPHLAPSPSNSASAN